MSLVAPLYLLASFETSLAARRTSRISRAIASRYLPSRISRSPSKSAFGPGGVQPDPKRQAERNIHCIVRFFMANIKVCGNIQLRPCQETPFVKSVGSASFCRCWVGSFAPLPSMVRRTDPFSRRPRRTRSRPLAWSSSTMRRRRRHFSQDPRGSSAWSIVVSPR